MSKNLNPSVSCHVTECRHHGGSEAYCTLQQVEIGKSEANVCRPDCTECASFREKSGCRCQ